MCWKGGLITVHIHSVKSAMLKRWLALFDERGHPFLLIFGREHGVKESPLEAHAFRQSRLKSPIYRLFCREHRWARLCRDFIGKLHNFFQELVVRDDAADETAALGLGRVDHPTR